MLMFILYLLIGALSGFTAGLLGVGGGIFVIPALAAVFLYFNVMPPIYAMHMAIGTSLAAMIITTASALFAYHKRGSMRWDLVWQLLPGLVIGAILGAIVANGLPSRCLQIFFSIFLLFVAYQLIITSPDEKTSSWPSRWKTALIASGIGALSSVLGIGGGMLLIPFMLRYRVNLRQAAGTAIACGMGIGIVATASFIVLGLSVVDLAWSTGYIYWPAFIGVAFMSLLFAPMGTALAHKLPIALLKRVMAVFLVLIALDMAFSLLK